MEDKKYKAAVYLRVANECQLAIESQEDKLKQFAAEQGYTDIAVYSDNGYNGLNFNRPAFMQMENDIQAGLIDAIIIKDVSRISRNHLHFGKWLDDMRNKNVKVISVNDNFNSDDCTAINAPFLDAMKKYYKECHSQKIKAGIARARQRKREQAGG